MFATANERSQSRPPNKKIRRASSCSCVPLTRSGANLDPLSQVRDHAIWPELHPTALEVIAERLIAAAKHGERDPIRLRAVGPRGIPPRWPRRPAWKVPTRNREFGYRCSCVKVPAETLFPALPPSTRKQQRFRASLVGRSRQSSSQLGLRFPRRVFANV